MIFTRQWTRWNDHVRSVFCIRRLSHPSLCCGAILALALALSASSAATAGHFVSTTGNGRVDDAYSAGELFGATGLEQHGLGAVPRRGTDPGFADLGIAVVDPGQTRWAVTSASERTQPWHFTLSAASPARAEGIVIPPHPTLGALPGSRSSRDIGALPFGTTAADFAFFPFDPVPNQTPLASAGPDRVQAPSGDIPLLGAASDDGHPASGARVTRWSQVSGPGRARFENPNVLDTRVSFSAGGSYILRLTVSVGEKTVSDDVSITTALPFLSVESRVAASADAADEGGPSNLSLASAALHVGIGKGSARTAGTRFTGLGIPQGSMVLRAYLQFSSYRPSGEPAHVTLMGQASDDAAAFAASYANLTSRPLTQATVSWLLSPWGARYSAGPSERSPDPSAIVQEIVERPGWSSGNALVLMCAGTGSLSAISADYPGGAGAVLHVDFVPPGALGVPEPWLEAGVHDVRVGASPAPGVYFYRIRAAGDAVTGRCLVLR